MKGKWGIDYVYMTTESIRKALESRPYNKNGVLYEVMRVGEMRQKLDANPTDEILRERIKSILRGGLVPYSKEKGLYWTLDLNAIYSLNKIGTFNRLLYRKCRVTEKGLLEISYDKDNKLKEIKSFGKTIELYKDVKNDTRIGWHSLYGKLPYRIVIIDKKDSPIGLYFESKPTAELLYIFLANQFRLRTNALSLFGALNSRFRSEVINSTAQRLRAKKVATRQSKSLRPSQSGQMISGSKNNFSGAMSSMGDQDLSSGMFFRQSQAHTSFRAYQSVEQRLSQGGGLQLGILLRTYDYYIKTLLRTWHSKTEKKKAIEAYKRRNDTAKLLASMFNKQDPKTGIFAVKYTPSYVKYILIGYKSLSIGSRSVAPSKNTRTNKESGAVELEKVQLTAIYFMDRIPNILFKPIVTAYFMVNGKCVHTVVYNSILRRKEPRLLYSLVGYKVYISEVRKCVLNVRVLDFLQNEEVEEDRVTLASKVLGQRSNLLSDKKRIKIYLQRYSSLLLAVYTEMKGHIKYIPVVEYLILPPLPNEVYEQINGHWNKSVYTRDYYNEVNLSVYEILQRGDGQPLNWWLGLTEEEYTVLHALQTAAEVLKFKLLPSLLHIVRAFLGMFSELKEVVEGVLSLISTRARAHYFKAETGSLQAVHRMLGLEEDTSPAAKVEVELYLIARLIELECPKLAEKMRRKNISIKHLLYYYIFDLFARNFSLPLLSGIWNRLFYDAPRFHLHLLLLSIVLLQLHYPILISVKRLQDVREILEEKFYGKFEQVWEAVIYLRNRHFAEYRGLLEEIGRMFVKGPLYEVVSEFYKKEGARIDRRQEQRDLYKKALLRRINKLAPLDLPSYPQRKYCLHIYFLDLPHLGGSVYLRCDGIEYECLHHYSQRYYIISEVGTKVELRMTDNKSNSYICELYLIQGVDEFCCVLTAYNGAAVRVKYVAGLLTEPQLDLFKKGRKFYHILAPWIKRSTLIEDLGRSLTETEFLQRYEGSNSKDDLLQKCRALFSQSSKYFSEIEFMLRRIEQCTFTLSYKLQLVSYYATTLTEEYFLSNFGGLQKLLFRIYLYLTDFPFSDADFECYYNDSLDYYFEAPKLLKCRFISRSGQEIKLEAYTYKYLNSQSASYWRNDIQLDELLNHLKPHLQSPQGTYTNGKLRLLYSNYGYINYKEVLIRARNNGKDIVAEEKGYKEVDFGEPYVLMSYVLPSFTKISTILDYVNTNRTIDLRDRQAARDKRKLAEPIEVLSLCHHRFSSVVQLRYARHPRHFRIPFLDYFSELVTDSIPPMDKAIFFNGCKSTLRQVCMCRDSLTFSYSPKMYSQMFDRNIGLHGNLRKTGDAKSVYFFTGGQEEEKEGENTRLFVNYGYGVFRWENCFVKGYFMRTKKLDRSEKKVEESHPKKHYLILHKGREREVRDYYLKLKPIVYYKLQLLNSDFRAYSVSYKPSSFKYLSKFVT